MSRLLRRRIGLPLQAVARSGDPMAWRRFIRRYRLNLRLERAPREVQRERLTEMLRELLVHAGRRVPWYGRLFREVGFRPELLDSPERLRELPPLSKEDIQDNLEELTADDAEERGAYLNSTGGSTGHPLNFYHDARFREETAPNQWVSDGAAGLRLGDRACVLWAARRDTRFTGRLRGRIWCALLGRRFLDAYGMSEEAMDDFARELSEYRPRVLIGYAESLDIFARHLVDRGIRPGWPSASVVSSAGMLYPDMRERIEEAFGVPVYDRYGCREVGLIAYECGGHRGYHTNVFNQVVELEEPESSEPSPVLVTNLSCYSTPFIRYRVGDLALPGEESACSCGRTSPRLSGLVGRMTGTIRTVTGRMIYGAYFRHALFGVMGLRRFQFVQDAPDSYRLLLEVTPDFDRAELPGIERRIRDAVGETADLETTFVDGIEPTESGKFLFVISKVDPRGGQVESER